MFIPFRDGNLIPLPSNFTFPFYYTPHPIALKAVGQLQERLKSGDFKHDF